MCPTCFGSRAIFRGLYVKKQTVLMTLISSSNIYITFKSFCNLECSEFSAYVFPLIDFIIFRYSGSYWYCYLDFIIFRYSGSYWYCYFYVDFMQNMTDCLSIHGYSAWCALSVMWMLSGVVLNYQYKVQQLKCLVYIFCGCLHSTCNHLRSGSHKILLSSRRPSHVTDEATGRALLVGYGLWEDVHRGIVCGVCPGCLQQGKKIQYTESSVEHKSDLMRASEDASAPGTVVDCDVMNIQ
jgi:hypothetical protein